MIRLLIIALLVWGLVRLWRVARPQGLRPKTPAPNPGAAGEMIACARCKAFVLKSEAIGNGERWYCCTDCCAALSDA